jgi:hypothetical protein
MIRIDEIYNNTLWTWLKKFRPGVRLFTCDPPGSTAPHNVINYGSDDVLETNYTIFFDVQYIEMGIHVRTFEEIARRNRDIYKRVTGPVGFLITSEKDSDDVDAVCEQFGWQSRYYFYWGWAVLDWYRGYDRTWLMKEPNERVITKTFICPNRIIGGNRQHRLIMLYHIFKNKLTNNWVSCPAVCPGENKTINSLLEPLEKIYSDIKEVYSQQKFPICFPNESAAPVKCSCLLSLFDEAADCLLYLVTETVAKGRKLHLTEKSFKPICLKMPFIIVGTCGSLKHLRSYGFKTFGDVWDESYDNEVDDVIRLERIASLLRSLDELSLEGKQDLFNMTQEIVEYNYNHFYNGGFEKILEIELMSMLESI